MFAANVGGLLGLCLGFSILSLVEVLYYISLKLVISFIDLHKQERDNVKFTNHVIPFIK